MSPSRAYAHERAPAKVTLALRVLRARPDGYHELEALTIPAAPPYDLVLVERREEPGIEVLVEPAGSAPSGADNLAARAAAAVLAAAGSRFGARIGLRKEIPAGAGLGGGSADAAAVLRVLGRSHDVAHERLVELAVELGADVAFCLGGQPAWMRGRGDVLEEVELRGPLRLVLATPPFGCPTAEVYRAWDALSGPSATRTVAAPDAVVHLVERLGNDLEPAAEHVEPRLAAFRHRFEAAVGRPVVLCGSGSSYACWCDDDAAWYVALEGARAALGAERVWAARALGERGAAAGG